MAGKGPPPKAVHLRQRQNKPPASAAHLPSEETARHNIVPELWARTGGWNPMVTEWWESIWKSPMASEFLEADLKGGLYLLAELQQRRWEADTPTELVKVSAEIRLQEVRFGLSPIDRSRLRWTIEQGETAAEKTESRRRQRAPANPKDDPRDVLKMVG